MDITLQKALLLLLIASVVAMLCRRLRFAIQRGTGGGGGEHRRDAIRTTFSGDTRSVSR